MWQGVYFKSAKNQRMNTSFAVNAIKKSLLHFGQKEGSIHIWKHYLNPAQRSYYLTLPCASKLVGDGVKTDAVSVVQRGMVQKLFKVEKTPPSSKGIMQAFVHLRKPYTTKSRKQLQLEDDTILHMFRRIHSSLSC